MRFEAGVSKYKIPLHLHFGPGLVELTMTDSEEKGQDQGGLEGWKSEVGALFRPVITFLFSILFILLGLFHN